MLNHRRPLLHPHTRPQRQRGLSLTELMISLLVGLLIMGAVLDAYLGITLAERDALNAAKLNMELRGALDVMTDDIRRAGSGRAVDPEDPNPFTSRDAATFSDLNINADGSCIEFSYDANGNSVLDAATEYYGFRIEGAAVQVRNGGTGMTENACGTNADDWRDLTDPDLVQIYLPDNLPENIRGHFTPSVQCLNSRNNDFADGPCIGTNGAVTRAQTDANTLGLGSDLLEKRAVIINLAGVLQGNPDMTMELRNHTVMVSNHRVVRIRPPTTP